MLDSKIPSGKLDDKWVDYKGHCKLVNPANKRKMEMELMQQKIIKMTATVFSVYFMIPLKEVTIVRVKPMCIA